MNKLNDLQILLQLLSQNPNITYEIIQQNPDKGWNYNYLSRNSNITYKIIQQNPDGPWNYCYLSTNTFNGRIYNWSKKLHKFYSKKIKEEIIHLIWIWKKSENVSKLPKDVLYLIISIIY
jgi:hypothetical protein